jgi:hypothetical protein
MLPIKSRPGADPRNTRLPSTSSRLRCVCRGQINQGQFNSIMNALAVYEETQYQSARDTEGSTGVLPY